MAIFFFGLVNNAVCTFSYCTVRVHTYLIILQPKTTVSGSVIFIQEGIQYIIHLQAAEEIKRILFSHFYQNNGPFTNICQVSSMRFMR